MNRLTFYGFALSMAVLLGGFRPLPAQTLDETARREQVAKQDKEQQIASLLKQAAGKKDKKEALALLEQASKLLQEGVGLGLTRTNELDDSIRAKIKALKGESSGPSTPLPPTGSGAQDDFQAQLNTLNQLRKEGRNDEARILAEKLNQQYPNRREAIMSRETTGMIGAARDQDKVQRDKRNGNRSAMNDVETANGNIPKDGVLSYPPDFKQKMEKRDKIFAKAWTPEEKALLQLLDTPTKEPVQFSNAPLDQVIKYLDDKLGLQLQLSEATLKDVQADYSKLMNLNIPKGTNRRAVLQIILSDLDLAYVIKEGKLVVMTHERASKEMITKAYYVADLNARGNNLHKLADMLMSQIEPNSWRKAGGPGHIVVDDKNGVLWITNTSEIVSRMVPYNK